MTADVFLSATTLAALRFIYEYRYLTVRQVATAVGLKPKSVSELLLRLERQKLLSHFGNVGVRGYGKTPKVYYLTKRGYEALAEEVSAADGGELSGFHPVNVTSRWSPQMYHRMDTLDVLMAVEAGVATRPTYHLTKTFCEYRRLKHGSEWVGETTDHVELPESSENKIVPDAGFILENVNSGARALFLIEVDRGTEANVARLSGNEHKSIRYKIEKYDRYLQGGRFRERYAPWGEFRYFTLLVVTHGEGRLANMRQALTPLPDRLHQYYKLSTIGEACGNLFHTGWRSRSANDEKLYGLIREEDVGQ